MVLPASPEDVWPALTEAERLARWLGGRVELDARPGGRVVVADEDGERWGTVEELRAGRTLVLRLWERSPGRSGTRVEFTLDGVEDGTRLTVVESRIRSAHRPQAVGALRG